MKTRSQFIGALGTVLLLASTLTADHAIAGGSGPLVANSQFRRTVDPSDRGPAGDLVIRKDGAQEFVGITIRGLNLTGIGTALGTSDSFQTNETIYLIAQLNRTDLKTGTWVRKFGPANGAPAEFGLFAESVGDLSGGRIDIVLAPPTTNVTGGVTNFVGGATNIVNGVTNVVGGASEIVGGTTNLQVNAYLWAPIPPLLANPEIYSFNLANSLNLPESLPPSPKAKGKVRTRFNAADGHSIFDVQASGLLGGQNYTLWVAGDSANTNFVSAGQMTLNKSGTKARFLRDTQFGDPLPQQVPDVGRLLGRQLLIKDDFGSIHLSVTLPSPD